jgi:hypothetical protein
MAITSNQFQAIADNIAKICVDLEASYITGTASADTTVNSGVNAASSSLFAHFAALSTTDQAGQIGRTWEKVSANVSNFTGVANSNIYALLAPYLEALESDMLAYDNGGIAHFLEANSLLVHPEFANAFNYMVNSGRSLGLLPSPTPAILPSSVMLAAEQVLASIAVTGAAAGTFAAGTALDLTKYAGPLQLSIKNTNGGASGGTATSFTITYNNGAGNSAATVTQVLSGALASGAKIVAGAALGISVSAITVNSGGVAADNFAIVVEPARTISY